MKAKKYHNGSFPRTFDKHEPPKIDDVQYSHPSKRKSVIVFWYVKRPVTDTRRVRLQKYGSYVLKHFTDVGKMVVTTEKRKCKNMSAALQVIESEKKHCEYFGYRLVNYRIEYI